ncbi:DUF4845 domain-containing protein [Pseudomonas oryzihabitans]|uniref:DUF4845 domain-containing protein n=1 Tax=Pseudomonas oryzihabitans TaxID=47885 RepID=A0A2Z5A8R3_9PSED|nr:DUF4845 domain-containing protein [Pseudomonas oryzihabitans]AXA65720.1 DUF4845 domain-containing protein [Pseudomonas oryzihabitans]
MSERRVSGLPSRQQGLSFLGGLLGLCVIAFLASTAMKLVPHYLDYNALTKVIESIGDNPDNQIRSVSDVYSYVGKGMQVNDIRDLDLQKAMRVEADGNHLQIRLDYEKREHLIRNIDLVVRFNRDFRINLP